MLVGKMDDRLFAVLNVGLPLADFGHLHGLLDEREHGLEAII